MHIYDLFEAPAYDIKQSKFNRGGQNDEKARIYKIADPNYRKFNPKAGVDILGKGVTAYAVSKKDKPHEVKKIVFEGDHPSRDPYFKFLKMAIKNQDSIFIPKIYSVKIFKYAKGSGDSVMYSYFYHIEMERLNSWKNLNWGQWSQLFNIYLGVTVKSLNVASKSKASDMFAAILSNIVRVGGVSKNAKIAPNSDLVDRLVLLTKIFKRGSVTLDLHKANMMYRITPYGVQPVIADPFYY